MKVFLFIPMLLIAVISNDCFAQTKAKPAAQQKPVALNIEAGPNIGDTGKVSFTYQKKKVTLTTVRAKDGNIWLQQNLGSTRVAASFDDDEAYGDLFQWGRWDDGHQVREPDNTSRSAPQPNNPLGLDKTGTNPFYYGSIATWWLSGDAYDTWTAATPAETTAKVGCDPCKALGAGWRIPNYEEFQKIVAVERITNVSSGWHSNLRLVSAGTRDENYGIIERRYTCYWTDDTSQWNGIGFDLSAGNFGAYNRGNGYSLRCIFSPQPTSK